MTKHREVSVLFVCMGNICRSPTAEAVFRSIAENHHKVGLKIIADSAGTHAYHIGNPPDARAQAASQHHGVDLSKLVARKVTLQDFIDFDYIIAMDNENLVNLRKLQKSAPTPVKASMHLFMKFAKNWQNDEVPDPYYGGESGFEDVYKMVSDASDGLLEEIITNVNN